jgi:hypothetical protein
MVSFSSLIKSPLNSTKSDLPTRQYEFHSQVGEMQPDREGSGIHQQFVPHFPSDTKAQSDTQRQAKVDEWLQEHFPRTKGQFRCDNRHVFIACPYPDRSVILRAAIGEINKYNSSQKSDIVYSIAEEGPEKCHVETFKGGYFCPAQTSRVGRERAGNNDVCLNLEYRGSLLDRPGGNARKSIRKQVGLQRTGSSYMSKDVTKAWTVKRDDGLTLCYVKPTQVSLDDQSINKRSKRVSANEFCDCAKSFRPTAEKRKLKPAEVTLRQLSALRTSILSIAL